MYIHLCKLRLWCYPASGLPRQGLKSTWHSEPAPCRPLIDIYQNIIVTIAMTERKLCK